MSDPIKRVALYARVSTADQSVGMQLDELRAVARQRGWEIVGEFVDEGVSGTATSRPALDEMLAAATAGRLDVVAVWKLDRLGRSLQHLLGLLDQLGHLGVAFVSVRDPGIESVSATGRLLLQLLGAFSEFEKSLIKERTNAGVARARAKGKHIGRPVVEVDLRPALAMLREGFGLKSVSKATGIPRSTLRRKIAEVGVQKSPLTLVA